jgi:hypothetical protein
LPERRTKGSKGGIGTEGDPISSGRIDDGSGFTAVADRPELRATIPEKDDPKDIRHKDADDTEMIYIIRVITSIFERCKTVC